MKKILFLLLIGLLIMNNCFAADIISPLSLTNSTLYANYTVRSVINSSLLLINASQVKITVKAGNLDTMKIASMYIGHAAASGDPYDFDGNQVQMLFSGSAAVSVLVNESVTSDTITFSLDKTKNLVISIYYATDSSRTAFNTITNIDGYQNDTGDESGVTNPASGWYNNGYCFSVTNITDGITAAAPSSRVIFIE